MDDETFAVVQQVFALATGRAGGLKVLKSAFSEEAWRNLARLGG